MANLPFVNKYGKIIYSNPDDAFVRHHTYVIVKSDDEILCIYHPSDELYALPTSEDLQVSGTLFHKFTTLSYLAENNRPIKEMQTYCVYNVAKDKLPDQSFVWCKINDIILNKVAFNLTQLIGIKHLIVRSEEL